MQFITQIFLIAKSQYIKLAENKVMSQVLWKELVIPHPGPKVYLISSWNMDYHKKAMFKHVAIMISFPITDKYFYSISSFFIRDGYSSYELKLYF